MSAAEQAKAKAQWMRNVLQSDLTHAEVRFALTVYGFMFGATKITAYPTSEQIIEASSFKNHRHFKDHRDALVDSGAWTTELTKRKRSKYPNYTYTLNLNWDGIVRRDVSSSEGNHETSGDMDQTNHETSRPEPWDVASSTVRHDVLNHGTSGDSKGISNVTSKGASKGASDSPLADALGATNSDSQDLEDDDSTDTSSEPTIKGSDDSTISEPSTTGTVDDSTSNESSTSEESIDLLSEVAATGTVVHGDSSTSEVLEVPAGSRSVPEHIGNPTTAAERSAYRKRILSQW